MLQKKGKKKERKKESEEGLNAKDFLI